MYKFEAEFLVIFRSKFSFIFAKPCVIIEKKNKGKAFEEECGRETMKKTLLKVFASMMALAMVVTALVIPNTEAKAADGDNWIVAGEFHKLPSTSNVKNEWNVEDDNAKMTLDGSIYKLDVDLGTELTEPMFLEFKVTPGNWDISYGDSTTDNGNYKARLDKGAKEFTITFDPSNDAIGITGEHVQKHSAIATELHIKKHDAWTDTYIYAYGTSGDVGASWPGTKLENASNGYYTFTIPSDATHVILNNNSGVQTHNIWVEAYTEGWLTVGELSGDKHNYTLTAVDPNAITAQQVIDAIDAIGTVTLSNTCKEAIAAAKALLQSYTGNETNITNLNKLTAAETSWANLMTAGAGELKVHVKADSYTQVYAYAFGEGGEILNAWPATKLNANANNAGWYDLTISIDKVTNLIFHNNDGIQTADIEYVSAGEYWYTITSDTRVVPETAIVAPTGWSTEENIDNSGDLDVTSVVIILFAGVALVAAGFVSKKRFA